MENVNYQEVCQHVGQLYLESRHQIASIESQAQSVIQNLNKELEQLKQENASLQIQLQSEEVK